MTWFSGDWSYRKSHIINAQAGADTLYQKRVKVWYGSGTDSDENVYLAGKCRTDFGDVRFCDDDGTTELDYWMEEKVDSDYVVFWVEIADDLSTVNATVFVYYGNANATTTSNGDDTFVFFDDFIGDSLNLTKWVVREGDVTVSDGELILTGTTGTRGRIDGLVEFNPNSAVHAKSRLNIYSHYQFPIFTRISNDNTLSDAMGVYTNPFTAIFFISYNEGTFTATNITGSVPDTGVYRIWEIKWIANKVSLYVDKSHIVTHTTNVPDETQVCYFRETNVVGYNVYVDWIFVRKYVDPEPAHGSWGSEEISEPPSPPSPPKIPSITSPPKIYICPHCGAVLLEKTITYDILGQAFCTDCYKLLPLKIERGRR